MARERSPLANVGSPYENIQEERRGKVSGVRGHAFPLILSSLDSPEQTRRRHPGNKLTSAATVEVRRCNQPPWTD